jgi:hypothetical protein
MQGKRFEESMKSLVVVARAQKAGQFGWACFFDRGENLPTM